MIRKSIVITFFAAMFAMAQEKPAGTLTSIPPLNFSPAQVRVLGALDYGQNRTALTYASGPKYRAFVFSGYGGDEVEISVKGAGRVPFIVTDSTLNRIAEGSSSLRISLPNRGPDIEVWYVLTDNRPAPFTLQVKKLGHQNGPLEAQLASEGTR